MQALEYQRAQQQLGNLLEKGILSDQQYQEGMRELEANRKIRLTKLQDANYRTRALITLGEMVRVGHISATQYVATIHRMDHDSGRFECINCTKGTCWTRQG